MQNSVYLLVGDDYAAFAKRDGVLTPTQLDASLQQGQLQGVQVVLGQGLDMDGLPNLTAQLAEQGVAGVKAPGPRAGLELTHKQHLKHVLVSQPEQMGSSRYTSDLIVDDAMDRLSDHVTGQHMGAMLLVEAARQASIAAIEQYCARADGKRWGLVLETMTCRFENYAFPVPTRLCVDIRDVEQSDSRRVLGIGVQFSQAQQSICRIDFDVTLYRSDLLTRLEDRRSAQAADEVMSYCAVGGDDAFDRGLTQLALEPTAS
jgi:A-factor biosynthesis hotdog domain